jgi:DNA-binding transcriptional regulator YiaG
LRAELLNTEQLLQNA